MKIRRLNKLFIILLSIFTLFLVSCKTRSETYKKEIVTEKEIYEVTEGEEIYIDVRFYKKSSTSKDSLGVEEFLTPVFTSSNEEYLIVNNLKLKGLKKGSINVTIRALEDSEYEKVVTVNIKEPSIKTLSLVAGEISKIESKDEEYVSLNEKVCLVKGDYVLAVSSGETDLVLSTNQAKSVYKVRVSKYIAKEEDETLINLANAKLNELSLEEKVGQMFIGSESGATINSSINRAITEYHLGNFIYMGNNCTEPLKTSKFSKDLQDKFKESNKGIPAFICIDQETGAVNRMNTGATRFLGNMALAATKDPNNAFLVGEAVSEELKYYGINFDLAPVLDVNNNPDNPIINNRSYGDEATLVGLFGTNMIKGLKENNVMSCSKHFPGHGNTSTDSHLALPLISSSLDELYKVELAPFIASIYSGIDAIMTTHIIFSAVDDTYPATLSKKVLTGLLREKLGYNGLIITDGMEMSAITLNYGLTEAAVLAINAGADILCYTSVKDPMNAIPHVINAVKNGTISEDRINDAVRRILIKKYKYNLFEEEYSPKTTLFDTTSHSALNLSLAKKAVTVAKGTFNGLDKTKKTLILSNKCSYDLSYSGNQNSFGYVTSIYLKEKGMDICDYRVVSSLNSSSKTELVNLSKEYEQVVVAIDSASSIEKDLVNELASIHNNLVVVALKLPYDYFGYENIKTFITIYDHSPIMVEALKRLMNGEYTASGRLSVDIFK